MSSAIYGTINYPCSRCLTLLDAFPALGVCIQRRDAHIERIYLEVKQMWIKAEMLGSRSLNQGARTKRVAVEETFRNDLLLKRENVFFDASYIHIAEVIDAHDISKAASLYLFLRGRSKGLKECTVR